MNFLLKKILGFAETIRDEIYSTIKASNPKLKPYEIWARYNAWDEKFSKHEYLKIKGGEFLPRLEESGKLVFWAKFPNFAQMGKFLDLITADENAVIDLDKSSWKLLSIDAPIDGLFDQDTKLPEVLITYKMEE